ncbi:tRNA mo(5)U34 methyltransferase [Actinobacillus equuli]|nr:tRNA mo(5)U34 methyltransferase [Actinobacillus equuli]
MRCVDQAVTTLEEQRKTDWLENESLVDFLDPNDHSKQLKAILHRNVR